MKNIYDAIREKFELVEQYQQQLRKLNAEIKALQAVVPMLEEAGDKNSDAFKKYERELTASSNGHRNVFV